MLEIHKAQLKRNGGDLGIINDSNLHFIIDSQSYYSEPLSLAAFLLLHIVIGHPFCDGNKRTAFMAAYILLWDCDVHFEPDDDDVERFMLSVARNNETQETVLQWLKENIT